MIDARENWKATFKAWHQQGKTVAEMQGMIAVICHPEVATRVIEMLDKWTPE